MKVFVTGGAGFIGRHLVESLLMDNHKVALYDNFSNTSRTKISHLTNYGVSFVRGDITNYAKLVKCVSGYDSVVHLAAEIDVQNSIKFPDKTNTVNVTGTINILRACVANKIKNIVAASSAAVFGNPPELPLSEKSATIPVSPYGASKLAMEHYLQAFSNSYGLNTISLRFFNVYGSGQTMQYAGVITRFMERIAHNKALEIFGDGHNTRDFVSVNDVVSSIRKSLSKIEGKKGSVYNIGSGKFVSIKELAKIMIDLSGKKIDIQYKSSRKGDIRHSQTSIALAKKELRYIPKVKLRDGLESLEFRKN